MTQNINKILASLLFFVALQGSAFAFKRALEESIVHDVSTITELTFTLDAGEHLFWTQDLVSLGRGCDSDPIMHVVPVDGTGPSQSNDDCTIPGLTTGANPCVRLTNPSNGKIFRVVVHAYATCTAARGTVRVVGPTGDFTALSREFGGGVYFSTIADHDIGWTAGDVLEIVRPVEHLPTGATYRGYVIGPPAGSCQYNATRVVAAARSGSHTGGVAVTLPTASSANCWSQLVVGSVTGGLAGRHARVYFNDVAVDADDDGLGNALEAELKTCAAPPPPAPGSEPEECTFGPNPQDTDNDGLPDALEVFGGSAWLALPRYGADPLHKDYFVVFCPPRKLTS